MATEELKKLLKEQKSAKKNLKKEKNSKSFSIKSLLPSEKSKKEKDVRKPSKNIKRIKSENKCKAKEEKLDCNNMTEEMYATLQNILPIKKISNGAILTTQGNYVRFVEIEPIAFNLKTPKERDALVSKLASIIKLMPDEFRIKSVSQKVDVSDMINNIQKSTQYETDARFIERRDDYIELIKKSSATETMSRRYFIIFMSRKSISLDEEAHIEKLNDITSKLSAYFGAMGCPLVKHRSENVFLAETLYILLNRKTSMTETYQDRFRRIFKDMLLINGEDKFDDVESSLNVLDLITSKSLNTKHKDYIFNDGLYYQYLYVDPEYFPSTVGAGFMDIITSYCSTIDVDICVEMLNKKKTLQLLDQTSKITSSDINSGNKQKAKQSYKDVVNSDSIAESLREGKQDLYKVSIFITLFADSPKALSKLSKRFIEDLGATYQIGIETLPFRQADMFFDTLPLMNMNKIVFNKAARNYLTFSLAAMFPFTCFSLYDSTGYLMGKNLKNATIVAINNFNTQHYKNANMVLMGIPGSGKTYQLLSITSRLRFQGIKTLLCLPLKGFEYKKNIEALGGTFIPLAPMQKNRINLLELEWQDNPDKEFIDDDFTDAPVLQKKITSLMTFLSLLTTQPLSDNEKIHTKQALIDMYHRFGFTEDNESIRDEKGNKKLMPTFGDWKEEVDKYNDLDRISLLLEPFVFGECSNMNGQTNVNADNMMTAFDVTEAGEYLVPFFYIVLDYCYQAVKRSRTEQIAVVLDECWKLMCAGPQAAEMVTELSKIVRGYAGSLICATQNLTDWLAFEDGKYGKAVINNAKIRILLNCGDEDMVQLQPLLRLTDEEAKFVLECKRGYGLLMSNYDKMQMSFDSSYLEQITYSTDHNVLRALAQERKNQKLNNHYFK